MQLILQDPFASLNPRMTSLDIIAEPLKAQGFGNRREIEDRVREVTEAMGLNVALLRRYPHAFSGGQRQRIGIARALVLNPKLVVCDEPVSALDVSVQAQIVNLLKDLQQKFGLTYLFIAHDLSVVENISTRVAVMYAGRIVETAETSRLFHQPSHPYTEALLAVAPKPVVSDKNTERVLLEGEVADPSNLPPGCAFSPRCKYCRDRCKTETPPLRKIEEGHFAACHFAETLDLRGV
jgi:peptide/nickel transport system ATP-binding protein